MSLETAEQFKSLGIDVDVSDPQKPHEWGGEQHRYISIGE